MIEWLRNRFSSLLTVLFIITVLAFTVFGGIIGEFFEDVLYKRHGGLIGVILGLVIGLLVGIVTYGFSATIVHMSESTDAILKKLDK